MPADYFAILRQPRLPSLDPESLKREFLTLSAECHPDKAAAGEKDQAEARFAELNAAYNCLKDSKERLRHLLELEGAPPAPHVQAAPPEVMDFFAPIAELTRQVDQFLAEKRKATSPILQARLFEQGLGWTDRVQDLQDRLRERMAGIEEELARLNAPWRQAPPPGNPARAAALPLERLHQIAAALGFLQRWNAQLRERAALLAF